MLENQFTPRRLPGNLTFMRTLTAFERWWLNAWPHRWRVRRDLPRFLRLCPEPFRGEVLEVGAGNGWTSQSLLQTFPQVELTAIDLTPGRHLQALAARHGTRLRVQPADATALPFDRATFNVVILVHTLHHVASVATALQQCLRTLRPGGLIGISEEDQRYVRGPLRWLWQPATPLTKDEVVQLLEAEGCEIRVSAGTSHYVIWARKPYAA